MKLTELTALSPIDGRYRTKTEVYAPYFSESGLIRYRVLIEVEYFIALCEMGLPQLSEVPSSLFPKLKMIYLNFTDEDAIRIKTIEQTTNHDVKAVEYFLKEKFEELEISGYKEFIHFGLTSQDINNTAIPLSIKEALTDVYLPNLERLLEKLDAMVLDWGDVSLLAKTHGQPASPTRLGKEIGVFAYRLKVQKKRLEQIVVSAKFGGATGNMNAHKVAYPNIDWALFGNNFVADKLGLVREQLTTQISNYDNLSALFDAMKCINTILVDYSRDMWQYISMEYFKQRIKAGEVGSSAMPHKVNPIDFENAEGNLLMANSILEFLARKLPVSRLQRDLTDSTVLRNVSMPFGHTIIATESLMKGIGKLMLNPDVIKRDLENSWAVVAEAVQTILRREGYPNPYEALKALTRTNEQITQESIAEFVKTLEVDDTIKDEITRITPENYTGI